VFCSSATITVQNSGATRFPPRSGAVTDFAGRSTQGVRLVRVEDDDQVAAASVIPEAAENGDGKNGENGQPDLPLQ
jgi:hypothetical protein